MLNNFLIALLGVVAALLLVASITWMIYSRRFVSANLTASLTLFLMHSCLVVYARRAGGPTVNENADVLAWIDSTFVVMLVWVIISAATFVFVKWVMPYIHQNFIIVRTPPGIPDKVVPINQQERKRA